MLLRLLTLFVTASASRRSQLILAVFNVTWKEAKGRMQAPVAECSAAEERLKALVIKLLQDLFADTDYLVELWHANQEECYEAVTSKILPALEKLEQENERLFATMRQVSDHWDARRLRVPANLLTWGRD
ncbi:hypothetical protein NCC49_005917 [Naganishia albida]|nr:hypothetical protein NCC49_005917 [Naganishia albida]